MSTRVDSCKRDGQIHLYKENPRPADSDGLPTASPLVGSGPTHWYTVEMLTVGLILQFTSYVCFVVILMRAFAESLTQGLLSLCLIPYAVYYAATRLKGKGRGWLLTGMLGGAAVGLTLTILGAPGA